MRSVTLFSFMGQVFLAVEKPLNCGFFIGALFFNVVKAPHLQKVANPTLDSHSFDKYTQLARRHALGIGVF